MEIQFVELHFRNPQKIDYLSIKNRAEKVLGDAMDSSDPKDGKDAFCLFHKKYTFKISDGVLMAATALLEGNEPIDMEKYSEDIQQSWGCKEASLLLKESQHTLLVTEMFTRFLSPGDRIRLFHGVLQAAIEETQPDALVFKQSQQVVNPKTYLDAINDPPIERPGSVNVRFFTITDSDGDMIMDTRGLTEIGLHDLQCHYRALDPKDVAQVLYSTALYIFQNGPVIKSGQTVEGIEAGSKWKCQFENSVLPPEREILDLNPGSLFAAGNRN